MRISAKAEYACLAVIALARLGDEQRTPVRIREIAELFTIPERYLVQILLHLKGAGLVYSARGSSGGYRLARPPEQISLGEVVYSIDGPGEPPRDLKDAGARVLAAVFEEIQAAERDLLGRTSIAQLAQTTIQDWVI
jgi:Rrf2 family transcriptional regulator, cysteine metabolism repressor